MNNLENRDKATFMS